MSGKEKETATLPELAREYVAAVEGAARYLPYIRDAELQQTEIERLTTVKNRIRRFKNGAVQAGDEAGANTLFHMQSMLNAHVAVLQMWLHLKKGENEQAWSAMIDGEDYVAIALKADEKSGTGIDTFQQFLRDVERVIFPGFHIYNSIGAVIRGGVCTVCDQPFHTCDHIEKKVYWGRFCVRVHFEVVEADHAAIVPDPKDRRCIIKEYTGDDGIRRDYITWKPITKDGKPVESEIGMMSCVLFNMHLVEVT